MIRPSRPGSAAAVSAALALALLAQAVAAPLAARADAGAGAGAGGGGGNPFERIATPRVASAQAGPDTPFAQSQEKIVTKDPGTFACPNPKDVIDRATPFKRLVQDYARAYRSDSPIERVRLAKKVVTQVFDAAGTPLYATYLGWIDEASSRSPEAIYDLAKTLQLRWEARYAMGLGRIRPEALRTGAQVGMIVGVIAYGALLWKNPAATPRYFSLVRTLLPLTARELVPLAGVGLGAVNAIGATEAFAAHAASSRSVPPAPARFMRLGVQSDELAYDDQRVFADLAILTGSMGMGVAAYRAVRVVQALRAARAVVNAGAVAAAPAETLPPVLLAVLASVAVSYAVTEGGEYAYDRMQLGKFSDRVAEARQAIDRGMKSRDDRALYTAADALMLSARDLSAYLNRDIEAAKAELLQDLDEAMRKHGEGSKRFETEARKLARGFGEKVREALEGSAGDDAPGDDAAEAALVLGYLRNHDEAAVTALAGRARARAQGYQRGFDAWLEQEQDSRAMALDEGAREALFADYIGGMQAYRDRELATELRRGRVSREPNRILLQAAAYLRMTGKDYVQDRADELQAMIARNDLMSWLADAAAKGKK